MLTLLKGLMVCEIGLCLLLSFHYIYFLILCCEIDFAFEMVACVL